MWAVFEPIFGRLSLVYTFEPFFRQYLRLMFTKLLDDGIIRWEMRTSLSPVYDETGRYGTQEEVLDIILEELEQWKVKDPASRNIFSIGIILQGMRGTSDAAVTDALLSAYSLREAYPELLIGFDLVGHEDPGKTLLYWAPLLLNITDSMRPLPPMPFFFHAGESNRIDVQVNLVDAVLLDTLRIGHGFGVPEFPSIWPQIASRGVLIEANPISNQVLELVMDQRNHPIGQMLRHALHNVLSRPSASRSDSDKEVNQFSAHWNELLAHHPTLAHLLQNRVGVPSLAVSINNDDPGFWEIDALVSYDWYIAVLAWDLSLGGVKQIALDSIVHSAASTETKARMILHWFQAWDTWTEAVAKAMIQE
jgi:adenosine deaminase CECR1